MQRSFNPEYFILLDPSEMAQLVTARNREAFQPELKAFLYTSHRLKELRLLSLHSKDHEWIPPRLFINDRDEILDDSGNIRGFRHRLPLPARPGEAQMALSYDWFWFEFGKFLIQLDFFLKLKDQSIDICHPANVNFDINPIWKRFINFLGSRDFIEKHMGYYFRNKLIYKQRGPRTPTKASAWDEDSIPIFCEALKSFLIRYYENIEKAKIQYFSPEQCKKALSKLNNLNEFIKVSFPEPNLKTRSSKPGDNSIYSCAGCGKAFLKKEKNYQRISAFLKDADERSQSGTNKENKNRYCALCALQVILCPLKLTSETLVVRFCTPEKPVYENLFEQELRKFTAHTLNINAGNHISLHITEKPDGKKLLSHLWGAYHYALWKMAVTFPPELFAQKFSVEVYPGEERFNLPRWSLWFISALAQWDNVFEYNSYRKFNTPFSRFLRIVSGKGIFQAFYILISNNIVHPSYARSWKMNALQEIWSGLETQLKEEDMPIPDYPMIAGFAGLLLPLAERVQSSKKSDNEKKRAITKLLEEADKPIQYAYTAARESGSGEFIFCKRPRNRFFYDKAIELLKTVGEDVETLQREGERIVNEREAFAWAKNAEAIIFISSDQIARATSALLNERDKPYANESDWRAFAYQVKLALWSFFPMYLGSQEK